jgi:outer membrane protein assembly factor BamB
MQKKLTTRRLLAIVALGSLVLTTACVQTPSSNENSPTEAGQTENRTIFTSRNFVEIWRAPGTFNRVRHANILNGNLYLAGTPRGLTATDVTTGYRQWVHTGQRSVDYEPTYRDGKIYILEGGQYVIIDAAKGDTLKRTTSRVGSTSKVYSSDSLLMVTGGSEHAVRIDPTSGYGARRTRLDGPPAKSTWDGEDVAFIVCTNGVINSVSVTANRLVWRYPLRRRDTTDLFYHDGMLYFGSDDFRIYAIAAAGGALLWKASIDAPVTGKPNTAFGRIYASTSEGFFYALDAKSGKQLWRTKGTDYLLTATRKHLITVRYGRGLGPDHIVILNAQTGEIEEDCSAPGISLFQADPEAGVIYAITKSGRIIALAHESVSIAARSAMNAALNPKPEK